LRIYVCNRNSSFGAVVCGGRDRMGRYSTHISTHTAGLSLWTDGFRLLPFRITKMSLGFCLFDSCLPA